MKFFSCIFMVLVSIAVARADRPAVHGMLVFGEKQVYLSHLPMFHAPHDYQAIFEVSFPPQALSVYLNQKHSAAPGTLFTLVPEPFQLDQMIKNPKPFHAVLYQGHFERGGVPITESVIINFTRVVFAKHLDANEIRPQSAGYVFFGNSSESFLAHLITGGPGFDQVIGVTASDGFRADLYRLVSFEGVSDLILPTMDQLARGALPQLSGFHEIYSETGDLDWP